VAAREAMLHAVQEAVFLALPQHHRHLQVKVPDGSSGPALLIAWLQCVCVCVRVCID
jgi:hypothetical protein